MMAKHGCSHLVYGYEHFDDRILKTIGKGSNRKTNIRSFFLDIESRHKANTKSNYWISK